MPETLQASLFPDERQPGEYVIPPGAQPTTCRSCHAPICWIVTEAGKRMPLSLRTGRSCGDDRVALSHFVDCPHRREWKRSP